MIAIEKIGQRIYFTGDTYPVKDQIKGMGGHWDADRRQWWVGAKKLADAERLASETSQPVFAATAGSAQVAARVGLPTDTPAGIVADKLEEEGRATAGQAQAVRTGGYVQRPARDVRLTGKGEYQGRSYYLGCRTKDGQRILILGLPRPDGTYFERWVPATEVRVTKVYQPREQWDGRRYSGRTVTVYQTLGSIAAFIRDQRNPDTARGQCTECGHYGPRGQACSECGGEGTHV
jgi:hypothetical protein